MSTFYMQMDLPVVSTTLGPTWAAELNAALGVVDEHDHTSGKGKQVPSAGININADLTFAGWAAINLKYSGYVPEGGSLAATYTNAIYSVNGDLYWNNGTGQAVKVTDGATINAASIGGIGGDYGGVGVPAAENYEQGSDTYHFYEDPTAPTPLYSDIKATGVRFVNDGFVGTQYEAKIINPTNQTENYTIKLPTAISTAGSGKLLKIDSFGNSTLVTDTYAYLKSFYDICTSNTEQMLVGNGSTVNTLPAITSANHQLVNGQEYLVQIGGNITDWFYASGLTAGTVVLVFEVLQGAAVIATRTLPSYSCPTIGTQIVSFAVGNISCKFTMSDATQNLTFRFTFTASGSVGVTHRRTFIDVHPIISAVV